MFAFGELPSWIGIWGSIISSPTGVGPGQSPGRKRVLVHLELEKTHLMAINLVFLQRIFIHIFTTQTNAVDLRHLTQKFPGGPIKFQEISRISRSCRHPDKTLHFLLENSKTFSLHSGRPAPRPLDSLHFVNSHCELIQNIWPSGIWDFLILWQLLNYNVIDREQT